jgi:hypothetical protein
MGQVTEETCRFIIEYADRDERFPLTVNEMRQLAYLANQQIQAARRTTPDREAWQPIETAPKDGTPILLSNGTDVEQGWWMHEEGGITEHRDMDGRYTGQTESDGFIGWWDVSGCMQPEPTHWMPLPDPPTSDQGEKS